MPTKDAKGFTFQGKGRTLLNVAPRLTRSKVPPLMVFSVDEWRANSEEILEKVSSELGGTAWIARSSCRAEDTSAQSLAGAFESVPNVQPGDLKGLSAAVETVIRSYGGDRPDDDVIVQEQVSAIEISGVVMTRDLSTFAPYYTVNYDESGSFDSVTSGHGKNLRTYIRMRGSEYPLAEKKLAPLFEAVQEIEAIVGDDALDIEFAMTDGGQVHLLQVRPMACAERKIQIDDAELETLLWKAAKKTAKLLSPHPGICGARGMYSVMTDWNPAEMIGIRPRRLALSLYREIITDSIWAHQRHAYGYRDLRGHPLLVSLLGQPYIDVRVSMNSFIPATLDDRIAAKLANYYMQRLAERPTDHDKIEFKIVFSCYYFNVHDRLKDLLNFGFSELELDRIKFSLLALTNHILPPDTGLYLKDYKRLDRLNQRYQEIVSSPLSTIEKIYWLIEDCKRFGTLPFAGLARAGFVAMQLLNSLVEVGAITSDEFHAFMNSLNTVARQLSDDTRRYGDGLVSRDEMITKYGHLRPGTYDILSPCYLEDFDRYFPCTKLAANSQEEHSFAFSEDRRAAIAEHLRVNGFSVTVDGLITFLKAGIEGREYAKFLFTRSLSQALVQIERLGSRNGLSREEMSFVDIHTLLELYADLSNDDVGDVLRAESDRYRRASQITAAVRLPQLIASDRDIYDFFVGEVEANFVTQRSVTEIIVREEDLFASDLSSKIVFIRSADPGYDWVFSRNIGGLVTMYGGANSHMAIRCAELQIPAVIGCGEKYFAEWSKGRILTIDCGNKQVTPVA